MRVSTPISTYRRTLRTTSVLLLAIAPFLVTSIHAAQAQQLHQLQVGFVPRIDSVAVATHQRTLSTVLVNQEVTRPNSFARSAAVGALIGAGIGAVLAAIQDTKTSGNTGYPAGAPRPQSDPLVAFIVMVPAGAALGALVGLIVGSRSQE